MFIAWKVTLECWNVVGMSHEHWPHANFTRFHKNNLGYFWPRLPKLSVSAFLPFRPRIPMVKVFVFLGHCWPRLPKVKVFVFLGHFWPRVTTVKVFNFEHIWPKMPMVKVFVFFVIFGQGYKQWKLCFFLVIFGQGCQRWKFLFFMDSFGQGYFCWLLRVWIPIWKLCLWFKILSNLWPPALPNASSRSLEAISGSPLCKQEFALWEATAGMWLQVRVYSYTGRQALAWKYEYLVPWNGTC